jgi:CrcB protein
MTGRDPREVLAVFAGGGLGALTRAALAEDRPYTAGAWPWVTFAVNLVGAFLLGYVLTRILPRPGDRPAYGHLLLGTGFCGALTTFSTMQLELLKMLDAGDLGLAAAYVGASIAGGYVAVSAGVAAARRGRVVA